MDTNLNHKEKHSEEMKNGREVVDSHIRNLDALIEKMTLVFMSYKSFLIKNCLAAVNFGI